MRCFHEVVFDDVVVGTSPQFTSASFNDLLGLADQLSFSGYTANVTGTAPTLTVSIQDSFDGVFWSTSGRGAFFGLSLSTAGETVFSGSDTGLDGNPVAAFARMRIKLGGTSPSARVVLWVTGRGERIVRAPAPSVVSSAPDVNIPRGKILLPHQVLARRLI